VRGGGVLGDVDTEDRQALLGQTIDDARSNSNNIDNNKGRFGVQGPIPLTLYRTRQLHRIELTPPTRHVGDDVSLPFYEDRRVGAESGDIDTPYNGRCWVERNVAQHGAIDQFSWYKGIVVGERELAENPDPIAVAVLAVAFPDLFDEVGRHPF